MRIMGFFVLLILSLIIAVAQQDFVNAGIYGYVNITILASPPSIAGIIITPEPAYPDSLLDCAVELRGNNLSDATLIYVWYVNGGLKGSEKQFQGFNARDNVTCEAGVYDSLNRGERKSNSTIIISRNSVVTGYIVNNLSAAKSSNKGMIIFSSIIFLVFILGRIK